MPRLIKQQLVDQVIDYLKKAITSGIYGNGGKLPAEPRLMEELGVGRSTVREAIRVLAHNGVLEVRQGDGTYVRSLPGDGEPLMSRLQRARVREVQEVRRALELEIVKLAAERRANRDLEGIRTCLEKRRKAGKTKDSAAVLDADIAFHCAVADASGNKVFSDLYRAFALSLRRALLTLWSETDSKASRTEDLHQKLADAIEARDSVKAMTIAAALLDCHDRELSKISRRRQE